MIMRRMLQSSQTLWMSRLLTIFFTSLAAASAVYWGLRFSEPAFTEPVAAQDSRAVAAPEEAAVVKALGGDGTGTAVVASPLAKDSRFVLQGVISTHQHTGAALIAVDGKPARPFMVGSSVGGEWRVQRVEVRRVVLERIQPNAEVPEAGPMSLELPAKKI